MELTHLRYFFHVATLRSFVRATEVVHVTPPTLSKAIAALEGELGVALLERTTRSVRLTHAGELVLERARKILDEADSLARDATAAAGAIRGPLRIGAMEVFSIELLPVALTRLVAEHPEIVPHVFEMPPDQIATALARGLLDVGFSIGSAVADGVVRHVLGQSPGYVVCGRGHAFHATGRATAQALAEAAWVVPRFFAEPHAPAIDQFPDARLPRRVAATIELLQSGIELVAGGAFVGCFPEVSIRKDLAAGRLRRIRGGPAVPPFELAVLERARTSGSPAAAALVRTMGAVLRERPPARAGGSTGGRRTGR
ncbi:MAG: LysR family transcriptional regulator [Myxococcota bacterium]